MAPLHIVYLPVWFILSPYVASIPIGTDVLNSSQRKGCITTLAMGHQKLIDYNTSIIERNKSIRTYLYTIQDCGKGICDSVADVVVFHEGNILPHHQHYIQSATPDMPMLFVNVSVVFEDFRIVNKSFCPRTIFSDLKLVGAGYHSMCYFWFLGFREYVKQYDWMLRFDSDCILKSESRRAINNLPERFHFGATLWLSLDKSRYDKISETEEGIVVQGMRNLTVQFARDNNIYQNIRTWKGPYTNVMYINLNWLRSNEIILKYMDVVNASECIYGNRWGDLPLWGAAIHVAKEPTRKLVLPYYHGSHQLLVK